MKKMKDARKELALTVTSCISDIAIPMIHALLSQVSRGPCRADSHVTSELVLCTGSSSE